MSKHFQEDITEHNGRSYRVRYFYDEDHDVPWDGDGRGIVTDWISDRNDKKPGWRPLHSDGRATRYFDWAGTIAKAKAESWGLGGEKLAALAAELGRAPTKGEITERAVQNEYDFFRAYCRDEWYFVGIEVTTLDADGEPDESLQDESLQDSCWGFETWEEYHKTAAAEMVAQLDYRVARVLAERAATEDRNDGIRKQARNAVGDWPPEIYDDAHVDEVDDGYWVTAKIFVPKKPEESE